MTAAWSVPADAVSGVYLAHLVRRRRRPRATSPSSSATTTARSELLFQTSDTTWQAYNQYGGNSLYAGEPGRARLRGQLRPARSPRARTRPEDCAVQRRVPDAPLARAQRLRRELLHRGRTRTGAARSCCEHRTFLSVGHDEYWSGQQRTQRRGRARRRREPRVLQRQRGVLEDPLDGRPPHARHLQGDARGREDRPVAASGPARGATRAPANTERTTPENALTGTLFTRQRGRPGDRGPGRRRPAAPVARDAVAARRPGATAVLPDRTLGYEWDEDIDNGSRPRRPGAPLHHRRERRRAAPGRGLDLRARRRRRTT